MAQYGAGKSHTEWVKENRTIIIAKEINLKVNPHLLLIAMPAVAKGFAVVSMSLALN